LWSWFTGGYGVVLGTNNLYDNLYLHDTNADGFSGSSDGFTLTNSIIENIGMIEGSGYGYGGRGSAMDYWDLTLLFNTILLETLALLLWVKLEMM